MTSGWSTSAWVRWKMTFGPSPSTINSRQVADKLLNGTGIHSHPLFDETLILAASVLCHYQPSQLVSFPMHRQMMRYDPEREEAKENGEKGGREALARGGG
jgi:hypothetical protein